MGSRELAPTEWQLIEQILGYLNFSSGTPDPQFLANLDEFFSRTGGDEPVWRPAFAILTRELASLSGRSATFADMSQAQAVLELVADHFLPSYRHFHADLLFHQTEASLFGPFLVGRACEAVLQQGPPWDETDRIISGAMTRLNDYVGHRPVATLENQRHEPYPHEWVRPVPLYVAGAGVDHGPYQDVVAQALEILQYTDPAILRAAYFDPAMLSELAYDPRAYDFDHPVNKRPNYHFGQWDPHHIDNQGRYRRFVVQQVTLDALTARLTECRDAPPGHLFFEAAAVLAGTILMASGISGSGPGVHDSSVTLSNLLPTIAAYRDAFYEWLIQQAEPDHRRRLQAEAVERRQPFGGARQHLNGWLAQRRASQLEHVHLATIFARMGHAEAAARQAGVVPVASARMLCEVDCRLTEGDQAVENGDLERAIQLAVEIDDLLRRAIQCGAVIDPWNILGFDAHFSLFPAIENSVHDHRADELIVLMEQVFRLLSRIWSSAAADDRKDLCRRTRDQFRTVSDWWRQFAVHEVSSVDGVDSSAVFQAAEHVAESLNVWHKGGAAAGDIRFWGPYAHMFDSPKAFALVIEALLERKDFVASMALLIHWLSQSAHVPLEQGDSSFYDLAQQWLFGLLGSADGSGSSEPSDSSRRLIRKFFDYLEANAGEYWNAPDFELRAYPPHDENDDRSRNDNEVDEEDDVYGAAYEDMVYLDSTDDGVEGELFETDESTTDELTRESQRLADRLAFLSSIARLWRLAAVSQSLWASPAVDSEAGPFDCIATMQQWVNHAITTHRRLLTLLDTVLRYRISAAGTDPDALLLYDRQRMVKDAILDRIVATCVDISTVGQTMLVALGARSHDNESQILELAAEFSDEAPAMVQMMAAVLRGDNRRVTEYWPELRRQLADKALLYVPLSKDGNTLQIVAARCRQYMLQDLLAWMPRRGLWVETCQVIETARDMEQNNPVGPGAVTEFDELFKVGYRSLVESLITSAESWPASPDDDPQNALADSLEGLTELLLASWLRHSRTLRLSVLERIINKRKWDKLVQFIKQYGSELFTQRFFNLGNVRAILHQGVGNWLRRLDENPSHDQRPRLLDDIDVRIPRHEAEDHLSLVLEAIVENYGEYRDYNSTTTQSDRGEMLYMLLDFLRLRTEYDRVCWHLKPVILAHEILVRRKKEKAALIWRRALSERIGQEAEQYLVRLGELQRKYSIRMSTVADRLAERFVRPMVIDRMCALVEPAMQEAHQPEDRPKFEMLEMETQALAGESTGIGFDVPVWLLALEEEVDQLRHPTHDRNFEHEIAAAFEYVALSRDQVRDQLERCARD